MVRIRHWMLGGRIWLNDLCSRYRLIKVSTWRRRTFAYIAEWRGYATERDWMSAVLDSAIDHEFDCFYDEFPDWRLTPVYKRNHNYGYIGMYLVAIIIANLTVAWFGPKMVIINAFLFIGLDLTARDALHDAWHGRNLWAKMAGLITVGSVLSWMLNQSAGRIALASFAAFGCAATVDTLIYHLLGNRARWQRVNGSNVVSAAVDSLVFPTLAFGSLLPLIIAGQFAAKVAGGFIWSLILRRG